MKIQFRYIVIAAILLLVCSAILGEFSNREARTQAKAIVTADVKGTDTVAMQEKLATYTAAHMQASVSLVLDGSFKRATDAANAASAQNIPAALYQQAQSSCNQGQADSIKQAQCVSAFIAARAAPQANPQPIVLPVKADYTKTFLAPVWTPDLTGFVAVLGWLSLLAGVLGAAVKQLLPSRR